MCLYLQSGWFVLCFSHVSKSSGLLSVHVACSSHLQLSWSSIKPHSSLSVQSLMVDAFFFVDWQLGLSTSEDVAAKSQRLCSVKQWCRKNKSLCTSRYKGDNERAGGGEKCAGYGNMSFLGRGASACMCVCCTVCFCAGRYPDVAMASQLSPVYVLCLLCSPFHLPRAVLVASRLAAFQKEQLPILVCLNAHRHTLKHTQRLYMHTHFENDP